MAIIYFRFNKQGFPNSSFGKESACNAGDPRLIPGSGRSAGEGIRLPTSVFLGFSCGSAGKESACNVGELGVIPGLGRPPGEGNDRGWDGWMASLTWWMWVWVKSGSWWWTGRPGVLRSMGSQRVGHDWETELNWTELKIKWRAQSYLARKMWCNVCIYTKIHYII